MIDFKENALATRHPELARLFEKEITEATAALGDAVCRIEIEGADARAPDRARIVILERDQVTEWTVALPATAGDVARAARRALAGRRGQGERRRPSRASLDRRRS